MSKPIKELILAAYTERFKGVDNALLIDVRGIAANDNNNLRLGLAKKDIRITVVKNTLARKAFAGTGLEQLTASTIGPTAIAWGAESVVDVARELTDWARKIEDLELKAAVLDGELFEGEEGVKRLSAFPTKAEAQAKVVQLFLSPASNVVGAAKAPGSNILGIIKELQDRLEKGETITKAG
jgi:large subunit ribosomal protein L10